MRPWIFLICLAMLSRPFAGDFLDIGTLYDGSPCRMEDGRPGICRKVTDCPLRMIEIREGSREADSAGRCGFDDVTEIVCCVQQDTEPEIRLADSGSGTAVEGQGSSLVGHGSFVILPEFPYVAALGYWTGTGKIEYTCAGSLISPWHVLTAAHCVHNINNRVPVEVRLGDLNLQYETSYTQRIPVKSVLWHEQYSRYRYYHDVAVITLERRAKFSPRVSPICLPTDYTWTLQSRSAVTDGTGPSLIVIGWGALDLSGPLSPDLVKSPGLSLVDRRICSDMYRNSAGLPRGIVPELLCAVDRNTSRRSDACRGDSGGPLVRQSSRGDTIFGITAFGQGCVGSVPGIYTAVYPYIEWIEKLVWGPNNIDIRGPNAIDNGGSPPGAERSSEKPETSTVAQTDEPDVSEDYER